MLFFEFISWPYSTTHALLLKMFLSATQASSLGVKLKHLRTEPSVLAPVSGSTSAKYCPNHASFHPAAVLSPDRACPLDTLVKLDRGFSKI